MFAISIDDNNFESVFMISSQLLTSMILGADFMTEYDVVVNFKERCLEYIKDGMMITCKSAAEREEIAQEDNERLSGNHSAVNHIYPDCHPVTPAINLTSMVHHYFTDFDNDCELYHDDTDYREIPDDGYNENIDRSGSMSYASLNNETRNYVNCDDSGTQSNESARDAIVNENIFNYDEDTGSTINEVKGKNKHASSDIHTSEPNLYDPLSMSSEEISALILSNENLKRKN
jgi:hypothetical protein